jgi:exoribonuclease R
LQEAFAQARRELDVPGEFSAAALAEAEAAARAPVDDAHDRVDLTDVPFITIDPDGSRDLDQAMSLQRTGTGFRVHYAIADLGSFVQPGGALDAEARERGVTLYCPDVRIPLTPTVLSESTASLLPDGERRAVVWTLDLDERGDGVTVDVRRAKVRSRAQLTFADAQRLIDGGDEQLQLLRDIGRLREERERARGGTSLMIPEQEVHAADGGYVLEYRSGLPVEEWNAHLSLLTGSAAAWLMVQGGVGVLRTMPPPDGAAVAALRRTAEALDVPWPERAEYADVVAALDPADPQHVAFAQAATVLVRGAGYTVVRREGEEDGVTHAAVTGPYAHVTAPLRRLVDRYATEVCLALSAGTEVPAWAVDALPALPAEMAAADRRANELERACIDAVEAAVLSGRVGQTFRAMVVDVRKDGSATVQLADAAVRARCDAGPGVELGAHLDVRLAEADLASRTVRFAPA